MYRTCWPYALIALFALAFFWPLVLKPVHGVLYSDHSDLLAEHVPAKRFLVSSWKDTGEMPLWCPYLFSGSPFVHDIQVGAFYPPHYLLLLLNEDDYVAPVLSWLVVLHVALAGWLMFGYARHRQLDTLPALVAAVGFMFGGRWLMHLLGGGHYILIGLAWLPLIILLLERGIRDGGVLWATGAGLALAMMILSTQPQWTFYSGLFAAVWTLGYAMEQSEPERQRGTFAGAQALTARVALLRWLAQGAVASVWAVALAAVQLLPTLEAARLSSRAAGVVPEGALTGGMNVVVHLIGPAINVEPFNLQWEDRGGLALVWLAAALLAPILCGRAVRFQATVCLGMYLFAMGGAMLFQWLPGFNLFRQPARMVVVAMFPVAFLAAATTQKLLTAGGLNETERSAIRAWLLRIGIAATILCGGFAVRLAVTGEAMRFHPYWVVVPVTAAVGAWLLLAPGAWSGKRGATWFCVLLLDLVVLTEPFVAVKHSGITTVVPSYLSRVTTNPKDPCRVLDRDLIVDGKSVVAPLGRGAPLALSARIEAVRGYSPLDTLRYREFLQFIGDSDRPLRALEEYTSPVLDNFPVVNDSLLNLLGVRYLLVCSDELPRDLRRPDWDRVAQQRPVSLLYDFISGGLKEVPVCSAFYNPSALPRAFLVGRAEPLPERDRVLATLKATNFRREVLLEDFEGMEQGPDDAAATGEVEFRQYEPNRVELKVKSPAAGYLVVTDVWYPGWVARIDGEPAKLYRANYLFRAIALPAGEHRVEFTFEPASFRTGRTITLIALGAICVLVVVGMVLRRARPQATAAS